MKSTPDGLTFFALGYLALPNAIFVVGWFEWPVALVICFALSYLVFKVAENGTISWRPNHGRAAAYLILATAFGWTAFGGGSHFMHAPHDWVIRDAVLGDLVRSQWPPAYASSEGHPLILRSAIGFFLMPALWGKLFGVSTLELAVYLWTAVGVSLFLFLLPLPTASIGKLAASLAIVVFFSGADVLGYLASIGSLPPFPNRIEWWGPYSYTSMSGQLQWAPNHVIPIWLSIAMLYRHRQSHHFATLLITLLPLTIIWTPFAIPGILPFAALMLWRSRSSDQFPGIGIKHVVAAVLFSLPLGLFMTADIGGIDSSLPDLLTPSKSSP